MHENRPPDIVPILRRHLAERPVEGETYSLYGASDSVDGYYRQVGGLAERCLERCPDSEELLKIIRTAGRNRRRLRKLSHMDDGSLEAALVHWGSGYLRQYTHAVREHLAGLPLAKRWDRTLSMSEEQYHLAMLEIEIANRMFGPAFQLAKTKMAFLPHCLRDWTRDCRSEPDGQDYVCKGCSIDCWVNGVSKLLRVNGVTPYIWMSADLSKLFRTFRKEEGGLGILGVACVPELVHGIRLCMRNHIPVVGVPLNANRCARWTGHFHENSVSLERLGMLTGSHDAA